MMGKNGEYQSHMFHDLRLHELLVELAKNHTNEGSDVEGRSLWHYIEDQLLDQNRHEGAFGIVRDCNGLCGEGMQVWPLNTDSRGYQVFLTPVGSLSRSRTFQ